MIILAQIYGKVRLHSKSFVFRVCTVRHSLTCSLRHYVQYIHDTNRRYVHSFLDCDSIIL